LIAPGACFPEAGKIAFIGLLFVDDGGNDFSEARIAKRGADVVRPPRDDRILAPLFIAFNAFDSQSVHVSCHVRFEMRRPWNPGSYFPAEDLDSYKVYLEKSRTFLNGSCRCHDSMDL
jgi:hypothetical protein